MKHKNLTILKELLTVIIIFSFFVFNPTSFAQNLVENFSLEDTVLCPTYSNQVERANGWFSSRSSPDYFHSCANYSTSVHVPNSMFGYQCPANGDAFCGFYSFSSFQNYREYLGTQLLIPLTIGQKYYVSLKVNRSDVGNCATNKLGLILSTVANRDTFGIQPIKNFAHIYSSTIITDTLNWTIIKGSFIADSIYKYLFIGNFFDDNNVDTLIFIGSGCVSYYFVDDVCISTDSLTCEIPNGMNVCDSGDYIFETNLTNESIAIYPNPTRNNIFIKQPQLQSINIKICNLFGQSFFEKNFLQNNIEIDMTFYPDGIYIIQLMRNNQVFNKKITLIK